MVRRIISILFAVLLISLFTACSETDKQAFMEEIGKAIQDEVEKQAKDVTDKAKDAISDAVDGIKEGAKDLLPGKKDEVDSVNIILFDRDNIEYVYFINDSSAVNLGIAKAGHNFIAFEDINGNGAVYSYGPVNKEMEGPARMWVGTFEKEAFSEGLTDGEFYLSAKRIELISEQKGPYGRTYNSDNEYVYGDETQKFDRYVKYEIDSENGMAMIEAADAYLKSHPEYGVFDPGKDIGQCDNMTSEVAGAGGKEYWVGNSPNISYNNIVKTWTFYVEKRE